MFSKLKRRLGYLTTRDGREFLRLYATCLKRRRYAPVSDVRFKGLVFDIPDGPSFFWQYVEIFRNQEYFFQADGPAPVIYDCGANVGTSAAYFKSLYPKSRVVAFEADEEIYGYLSRNLERNGLTGGVELRNAAVWTHSDGVSFAPEGSDAGHVSEDGEARVPSVSLRALLEGERQVDFLKMDIEGAESSVIPDIQPELKKVHYLFCEYHQNMDVDTTQHNTTQHNTTQHNTTQHNTTQHNTTQHNYTIGNILSTLDRENFQYVFSPVFIPSNLHPFERIHSRWQVNLFAVNQAFVREE